MSLYRSPRKEEWMNHYLPLDMLNFDPPKAMG